MRKKHPALHREVIVNGLPNGEAIRGLLADERGDYLIIRSPELLSPAADGPEKMDGEVVIKNDPALWIQAFGS